MKRILYFFILLLSVHTQTKSQCSKNEVEIIVTVVTDLNGDDNSWTLKQGSTIVLEGGPYNSGKVITDIQKICVPEGTELLFSFHDSGADGIGNGYFMVESCGNILAYHTGYMSSWKKATIRAQSCRLPGKGEVEVYTKLNRVITMDDIRWNITGSGGLPVYANGKMENSVHFDYIRTTVPEGTELEFRILNLNGGGFSGSGPNMGSYEFGYNCVQIAKGGQDFDIIKVIPFTAPYSNNNNIVFERIVGEYDNDRVSKVKELCEGGYILAGTSGPENVAPQNQAALIKVSPEGDIIWFKKYGDSDVESAGDVHQTSEGGFVAAGTQILPGTSNTNIYLFNTDHNGNLIWERNIGGLGFETANAVIETSDGNLLIAGGSNDPSGNGSYDAYVIKTNSSGSVIWEKFYGNEFYNIATDVAELDNGDFLISGTTKSSNNFPYNDSEADAWLIRIKSNGDTIYSRTFGGDKGDKFNDLLVIDQELAYAAGSTQTDSTRAYLVKIDITTGKMVWEKIYGEGGTVLNSLDMTLKGDIFTSGTNGNYYLKTQKACMSLLDHMGEILWTKNISHPGVNVISRSGIVPERGGYFLAGETYFNSFPSNRPDIFYLKTDEKVSLVSVPEITGDSVFCEGDSVILYSSVLDVASGIDYTWSNGQKGTSAVITAPGEYTVTLTDTYGNQKTSSPFKVNMIPAPKINLISDDEPEICFGTSIDIRAEISNAEEGVTYSYLWNTGETESFITTDQEGKYSVQVMNNEYGCTGLSGTFTVKVQKPYNREEICLVTVDKETGKNMIVYTKTPGHRTKAFIIWKETSVSYVYEPVGAVPYNELNYFIDESSNPGIQADRYRLSVLDVCDNQSLKSRPHKTMHLTVNAAGGGQDANNLIWDHYEGFLFGSYTIYRGPDPETMDSIHSIQSTLTSWTDDNPPEGNLYYQVGVRKFEACYLMSEKKVGRGPYKNSLSNLEDNKLQAGLNPGNSFLSNILVYPNPYSEHANIVYSVKERKHIQITVYNSLGQKITDLFSGYQDPADYHFRFSGKEYGSGPGLFMIRIQAGNEVITKMLVEE